MTLADRRCRLPRQREAHELLLARLLRENPETPLADEERLVHLEGPVDPELERVRNTIRVLADDQVSFLETQQPLRLDAERADLSLATRLEQRTPELERATRRHVDLVAELTDNSHSQEPRG